MQSFVISRSSISPIAMGLLSITVIDHHRKNIVLSRRFERLPVRIGRHTENDVCLDYPFVARWHAEVRPGPTGGPLLVAITPHNGLVVGATSLVSGASVPITRQLSATLSTLELRFEVFPPPEPVRAASPESELPDLGLPEDPRPSFRRGDIAGGSLPDLPADDGRHAARRARLQALVASLRPIHRQFEATRHAWEDACVRAVHELRGSLDHEPADLRIVFREFPPGDRPAIAREDEGVGSLGELGAVAQAASSLLPGLQVPTGEAETRRFLARMIDILRVFAACTLELHRVRGRQATDLGVTWEALPDPLAVLETREDLLRYLLDWRDTGEARSEELVRSFAGLVDHLQCYVQGALSGAREVVLTLSPSEMERSVSASWPTRTAALWRHYEACFASLCGDTYDHLTPAFRAILARTYSEALARAGVPVQSREPGALA